MKNIQGSHIRGEKKHRTKKVLRIIPDQTAIKTNELRAKGYVARSDRSFSVDRSTACGALVSARNSSLRIDFKT